MPKRWACSLVNPQVDTRMDRKAIRALPCDIGLNKKLVALKGSPDGESVSLRRKFPGPTPFEGCCEGA